MAICRLVFAALLLSAAQAQTLLAQKPVKPAVRKPALLIGIVADTGRKPIADAEIVATRHKLSTITGSRGVFILTQLDPGDEVFLVRHIGYRPESFDAKLLAGFAERMRANAAPRSSYITQADIDRLKPTRTDLDEMMAAIDRLGHGCQIRLPEGDHPRRRI